MRPAPLRPLRRAVRSWRSRPHRGLGAPLLIALALAGTGQYVSSEVARAEAGVPALSTGAASVATGSSLRHAETLADLRVPAAPLAEASVRAKAPAPRTPPRATRSAPRPSALRATGRFVRPCAGAMTSPYGERWGRMHRGIDLCGHYGVTVVAAGDGVVILAGQGLSGFGNQVQIRHSDGSVTSYSHLSRILVHGGRVSAGTPIGRTGSTGHVTGPHLHFEVKIGGVNVNPRPWLAARGVYV
jgi:murein DD-endopeptidase MepM/ murein hydrolase activator NlpD